MRYDLDEPEYGHHLIPRAVPDSTVIVFSALLVGGFALVALLGVAAVATEICAVMIR